ncbi:MAG: helix-turn-helix domain-containing protein [Actinobacteria bacterium]|uniref:Unannotated protein n=1 Tax=freshwater metagenome TaxID=449393 RepID=A0A6J5Z0S4_9ZZZZ|nr:helix-turn-helix domain-containing protein [Actinomycetota bacterium]
MSTPLTHTVRINPDTNSPSGSGPTGRSSVAVAARVAQRRNGGPVNRHAVEGSTSQPPRIAIKPVLLRHVIGEQLRRKRQEQHRTLREVSRSAQVSLGYLSEVERGQKEASSELLASICNALGASLSDLLIDVSAEVARRESKFETLVPLN